MTYDVYSAFGNMVRNKLILCLEKHPKNVTQLIQTCGLAQSAVSQHLRKLKQSGVVYTKKDGKEVWYFLRYKKAADISRMLIDLSKEAL